MKKILKLDGYLALKHRTLMFLPFLLACTAGAALHLWLLARRGSGMAPAVSLVLMQMLLLAGSLAVPLTVLLEEKDIGFAQLLAMPLDRDAWARAKYLQLLLTACLCFLIGAAAYVISMRQLRPFQDLCLPAGLLSAGCYLTEMLVAGAWLIPLQLELGAERGLVTGLFFPLLPLHLLMFWLVRGLSREGSTVRLRSSSAAAYFVLLGLSVLFSLILGFRRTRKLLENAVTDGDGLCQ